MPEQGEEFVPDSETLAAIGVDTLARVSAYERALRAPIRVRGHVAVNGVEAATWLELDSKKAGGIAAVTRLVCRATGDPDRTLYKVQVRIPPRPSTGWSGVAISGAVVKEGPAVVVEPRAETSLYNVHDWLRL